MADKSMYEEMGHDMAEGTDGEEAAESDEEEAKEAADLDEEFKMHAEKAGMDTPEKMEAFKMAIERCVELREEKAYSPSKDDTGEANPDDMEI